MTTMMTLAAAFFAAASPARASDPRQGPPDGSLRPSSEYVEYQKKVDEEGPDPTLETEHYGRQLKLSDEQKKKVHVLFEEQRKVFKKSYALRTTFQKETEALHQRILELNRTFEEQGREIEAARKNVLLKVRALLDEKQKKTFDVVQEQQQKQEREWIKRKEAEDQRREGGDGNRSIRGGQDR